ncbi:MAG: cobalt ABC transporter permease, partial [Fusobacteriales bacterium]|nr:cobalt ABC transporter permease [Fusobacteriales bacterium]
ITAQKSRSGYVNYSVSKRSFGILLISILRKIYYYGKNSAKAVEARLGNEFIFYQRRYSKPGKEAVFIITILLINLFLVVWYA